MTAQVRIQRHRTKGWRLPENAICVTRPGLWGNPFVGKEAIPAFRRYAIFRALGLPVTYRNVAIGEDEMQVNVEGYQFDAVASEHDTEPTTVFPPLDREWLDELHGRDLACWCDIHDPCHADFLLELMAAGVRSAVDGSDLAKQPWPVFRPIATIRSVVIGDTLLGPLDGRHVVSGCDFRHDVGHVFTFGDGTWLSLKDARDRWKVVG